MSRISIHGLIKPSLIFFLLMFIRQIFDVEKLGMISQQTDFLNDPRLLKYQKNAIEFEDDFTLRWENFTLRFLSLSYEYKMSILKKQICKNVKLLIMVPSRPTAFGERREIRLTWSRTLPENVRVYFIIGKNLNNTINNAVMNEAIYHKDVIMNDLYDSYTNLTLKIYSMLQWQQAYCAKTLYTLKTDDDTIVHVQRLLYWIRKKFNRIVSKKPKTIFGRVFAGTKVNRDPKKPWYVDPVVYNKRRFPAYCNGPTYILSKSTVRALLSAAANVRFMTVEDILFTGILAKKANVYHIDTQQHFGLRKEIRPHVSCDRNHVPYITSLYNVTKQEMKSYYHKLNSISCYPKKRRKRINI